MASGFKPIHRETLEQQIFEVLRTKILSGDLPESTRLVQEELASQMGTSRIPVRDALRKLATEGLVEMNERGVLTVVEFKVEELQKIYEIRIALESMAVRSAVEQLSADELGELKELINEMETAVREKNVERYLKLNFDFHTVIYEASRSRRLIKFINSLWSGIPPLTPLTVRGQMVRSFREHQELFEALKKRDGKMAEIAIVNHIKNAERMLLSYLDERGQQQDVPSVVGKAVRDEGHQFRLRREP